MPTCGEKNLGQAYPRKEIIRLNLLMCRCVEVHSFSMIFDCLLRSAFLKRPLFSS